MSLDVYAWRSVYYADIIMEKVNRGPIQNTSFSWAQYARLLRYTWLEMLDKDKHSSFWGPL